MTVERGGSGLEDERYRALGLPIVEKIRHGTNNNTGYFLNFDDGDLFTEVYLTERAGAVPEAILDDPFLDIRAMYAQVFHGVREQLAEEHGMLEQVWIYVDPWVDGMSTVLMTTDHELLLLHRSEPWRFFWKDEHAMATDLGRWYETAARRLLAGRDERKNDGKTRS